MGRAARSHSLSAPCFSQGGRGAFDLFVADLKKERGRQEPVEAGGECEMPDVSSAPFGVRVRGVIMNTGRSLLLRAEVTADPQQTCVRCLAPYRADVRAEVEEEYFEASSQKQVAQAVEEGSDRLLYVGNQVSLLELLRQVILLNLPSKPLCRPSCRGLCTVCGQDLNRGTCDCQLPRPVQRVVL